MAYITQRNNRFYVIAYDGLDPLTGRERRRWHSAGANRTDAEAILHTLDTQAAIRNTEASSPVTFERFLTEQWLPCKQTQLRPTTWKRYAWIVDNYINPRLGDVQLRSIRPEHLEALYQSLLSGGRRDGRGLAPKTVYDVHVVIRSALAYAKRRHLVAQSVATETTAPRPHTRLRKGPETWTAEQVRDYLASVRHLRLHPALHLAAMTGMRRGELAGLRWGDWQRANSQLTIARARQSIAGRSIEVPCKTHTSRRCLDLDPATEAVLAAWKRRQRRDGHPVGADDPMFTNHHGEPVHPESLSQLFCRNQHRVNVPTLRFHGLRHTHASLLVVAGTPIKVVSERLGHANPGFTMATYQHLIPGMTRKAAIDFANLIHPDNPDAQPEHAE